MFLMKMVSQLYDAMVELSGVDENMWWDYSWSDYDGYYSITAPRDMNPTTWKMHVEISQGGIQLPMMWSCLSMVLLAHHKW